MCGAPTSKNKNVEIFIFPGMSRYLVHCINHIHIYFVSTNAVRPLQV